MPFEGLEAPHAPENPSDSGARAKPPPCARVTPFPTLSRSPFPARAQPQPRTFQAFPFGLQTPGPVGAAHVPVRAGGGGLPRWTQGGRAGPRLPTRTCVWVLPVESWFLRVIFLPRGMRATGKGHLRLSYPPPTPGHLVLAHLLRFAHLALVRAVKDKRHTLSSPAVAPRPSAVTAAGAGRRGPAGGSCWRSGRTRGF